MNSLQDFIDMRDGALSYIEREKQAAFNKGLQDASRGRRYNNLYRYFSPYLSNQVASEYDRGWQHAKTGYVDSEVVFEKKTYKQKQQELANFLANRG